MENSSDVLVSSPVVNDQCLDHYNINNNNNFRRVKRSKISFSLNDQKFKVKIVKLLNIIKKERDFHLILSSC